MDANLENGGKIYIPNTFLLIPLATIPKLSAKLSTRVGQKLTVEYIGQMLTRGVHILTSTPGC